MLIITICALTSVLSALCAPDPAAATARANQAASAAQDQSTDKRAQALKKFLEAQNLEKAGNYPGAVAAYK
ncbi:MAG TPA: hypothetical protein VFV34_03570, partial [Blastocatellia bacterium]|nr:hypothetical protein [Blastocatellia bacterium]